MIKIMIGRMIKKYGMKKLLLMIGDYAVKATKSRDDDKIRAKVKSVLNKF